VHQAARRAQAVHLRFKLAVSDSLECAISSLSVRRRPQDVIVAGSDPYELCKAHFSKPCEIFVASIEAQLRHVQTSAVVVVHVDEAQVLMGHVLVTRSMPVDSWLGNPAALRSFALPQLCDYLNVLANRWPNIVIVMTGTNAFSSLVLNAGSQLKVGHIPLLGRFPVDWVMQELVGPHFELSAELKREMLVQLESMCANRRACWYFLRGLWQNSQLTHGALSVKMVRDAAATGWSDGIRRDLAADSAVVIRAWALLEMPEAYNGKQME
jgi:hypothetical protein